MLSHLILIITQEVSIIAQFYRWGNLGMKRLKFVHVASKWQSHDSNLGLPNSKSNILAMTWKFCSSKVCSTTPTQLAKLKALLNLF